MEKTCWKCKQTKPLSLFWNDKYGADGKQKACIECQKAAALEFRNRHPDYFKIHGTVRYYQTEKHKNKERYSKSKEDFKRRHKETSMTVRGRLLSLLTVARSRAAKVGRVFELDIDFITEMWTSLDGKCSVTGLPMSLEVDDYGRRFSRPYAPSIDRINAEDGYTKDNVRLVCTVVNLALNRFGDDVFDNMCRSYLANKSGT